MVALRVFGVVAANAVAQALLVIGDPVPTLSWSFAARTLASFLAVVAALWIGLGPTRAGLVWSVVSVLLAVAAAVVNPILPIVVFAAALVVLPAAPSSQSVGERVRIVAGSPVRSAVAIATLIVLVALGWVAALVLGLFVTGPMAALLTWLVFGLVAALVCAQWRALTSARTGKVPIR